MPPSRPSRPHLSARKRRGLHDYRRLATVNVLLRMDETKLDYEGRMNARPDHDSLARSKTNWWRCWRAVAVVAADQR